MPGRIASLFRNLLRKRSVEQALDDELQSAMEVLIQEKRKDGLSHSEARRQALIELGGVEQVKEEVRAIRFGSFLETFVQDLGYALRMLRKSPGFTAVAALTLALGIGANTAIFSVLDGVMLRSLPVQNPQHLALFTWTARVTPSFDGHSDAGDCDYKENVRDCSFSVPLFKIMSLRASAFSSIAAFAGPMDMDFRGNGTASIARGTFISGDFFATLGVNTILGRPIGPSDDSSSTSGAIVLSYAYWQRALAGDDAVLGHTVWLDNVPFAIVGVADPRFTSLTPGKTEDFFIPLSFADRVRGEWWGNNENRITDAGAWWVNIIGRLKPNVSFAQAQTNATAIFRNEMIHGARRFSKETDDPAISLLPASVGLNGERAQITPMLYLLMIAVALVLLITCANVAGLMLARSTIRQKEMAVRLALGAGRSRLIRQLLTEGVLLSVIGGALGILVAVWGVHALTVLLSSGWEAKPFSFVVAPDWRVLAFTIAVTLATGILFGLAPALRSTRVDLTPSLKERATSHLSVTRMHQTRVLRLGDSLVIVQVALSMIVLVGAGLFVRTLRSLHNLNPGFDAQNILLFGMDPAIAGYTDQQTRQLYANLQRRFAALPGVISASYSENALVSGSWSANSFHLDGTPPKKNINTATLKVGLDFFSTMRIPLFAGRTFTSADFATAANNAEQEALVAAATKPNPAAPFASTSTVSALEQAYDHFAPVPVIVNETFARKFFPGQNPVGKHMGSPQMSDNDVQRPGPGYIIIGVVGDTKYRDLRRAIMQTLYRPLVSNIAQFEVRTASNPTTLIAVVREIASRTGDNLPLFDIRTQTEQIEESLYQERLMSQLSTFFAALALVLACIGLYGLLSYEVSRRTRELGIRMALGAQRRDLLRLVVGQGILLVLIGAAIGIAGALGVTRFMSTMLYGIRANDPLTFVAVAILLALVALVACHIPARRAMRVDPMVALRYE